MDKQEIEARALELARDVAGDYDEVLPRIVEAIRDAVSKAYDKAAQAADATKQTWASGAYEARQAVDGAAKAVRTLKDSL